MATKNRKDRAEAAIIAAIQKASEVAKEASEAATKSAVLTEKATKAAESKTRAEMEAAEEAATEAVIKTVQAVRAAAAAFKAAAAAPKVFMTLSFPQELAAAAAAAKASAYAAEEAARQAAIKAKKAEATLKATSKAAAKTAAEAAREASKAAKEAAKAITAFMTPELTAEKAIILAAKARKEAAKATKVAAEEAQRALEVIKPAAKAKLKKSKKKIKENKPKPSGVKILNPSDDSDWHLIKYYPRLNKEVKVNFKKDCLYVPDVSMAIQEAGPRRGHQGKAGNVIGNLWHKFLGDAIKGKKIEEEAYKRVCDSLFEKLREPEFGCMDLFDSNIPLYGFMYDEEQTYFWRGDADAIGWYYNEKRTQYEYVIVDWKILPDIADFWESSEAFGKYLHQCLVYAKLFQLHLDLHYLPSILIVPISSVNGKDIYPGLFWDYPDECKRAIDERFSWSIEQLEKPPRKVLWTKDLFNALDAESDFSEKELLKEEKLLKDLFADGAKVKDLLKTFNFSGLKVIIENLNED